VGGDHRAGNVGVGDQLGDHRLHSLPDRLFDSVPDGVGDRLVRGVGSGDGFSDRVVHDG
jgi:hypothetical protein